MEYEFVLDLESITLIPNSRDFLFVMRKVDFNKVKGAEGVAHYFYISSDILKKLITVYDQSSFYKKLKIRKKNFKNTGKYRTVYKAEQQISQFQKNVATAISDNTHFPKCVQGFVKKRSPRTNAKQHLTKKYLLNADICDFFDSITFDMVKSVFVNLDCDEEVSHILAKACTLNGVLRQGLHTSPMISNLVVAVMDQDFIKLNNVYSATYTRYSDDITISSDKDLPGKEEVVQILQRNGFNLNEAKFRLTKRGQPQFVTGLSVFDSEYPRIPKQIKRRLRLELYYINKYGLLEHFKRIGAPDFAYNYCYNRIRGIIDYINAIEPDLAEKLYKQLPYQPNYKRITKTLIKNPEQLPKSIQLKLKND